MADRLLGLTIYPPQRPDIRLSIYCHDPKIRVRTNLIVSLQADATRKVINGNFIVVFDFHTSATAGGGSLRGLGVGPGIIAQRLCNPSPLREDHFNRCFLQVAIIRVKSYFLRQNSSASGGRKAENSKDQNDRGEGPPLP